LVGAVFEVAIDYHSGLGILPRIDSRALIPTDLRR
jgi:hypothetical protein